MVSPADELIGALADAGATTLFGLPGGGPNLDVVGAALDRGLDFVLAHGENAAAIMASTHGLLTNAPTPVVVTRGPGATSVTNGAAQATLDRYPLVVITDTVAEGSRERVAHQRIDQRALFAPIAKLTGRLGADVTSEQLTDAATAATTWPGGTVHLDYDAAAPTSIPIGAVGTPASSTAADMQRARDLIAAADRPLVIVGMEAAVLGGQQLADALHTASIPTLSTYQAIGLVPTESDINAGLFTNGALEAPVLEAADAIVTIGLDTVEPIPAPWTHEIPMVSISTNAEPSAYFPPADVSLIGDLTKLTTQLLPPGVLRDTSWSTTSAKTHREAARASISSTDASDEVLDPTSLVKIAAACAPPNLTTTVDAGAHFLAVMPLWPVKRPFDLLISNGLATMGFAVPAAIGAAVARPGRAVLALTGDGGLGMTLAELETIVRLQLPITVLVFNDATLSLIKIKQQAHHGGREVVGYGPTDFAAVASASGMHGMVVSTADELQAELSSGWDRPRLIDARVDPSDYQRLITATRG